MGWVDGTTLVLIIAAGLQLGGLSIGHDWAGAILGTYKSWLFASMGISAIWQLLRQPFG